MTEDSRRKIRRDFALRQSSTAEQHRGDAADAGVQLEDLFFQSVAANCYRPLLARFDPRWMGADGKRYHANAIEKVGSASAVPPSHVGLDQTFRKFFRKLGGVLDFPFPEISPEIWGSGRFSPAKIRRK